MELDVQTAALLLLVAAVVAMLTRRLRLPYSVGLVVAGICLAALPFAPKVSLTKDLIFTVLLPPLLFEAAFYIPLGSTSARFSRRCGLGNSRCGALCRRNGTRHALSRGLELDERPRFWSSNRRN